MTIHFKKTAPDHAHIYHGRELVGELTRQPDLQKFGSRFYVRAPLRIGELPEDIV